MACFAVAGAAGVRGVLGASAQRTGAVLLAGDPSRRCQRGAAEAAASIWVLDGESVVVIGEELFSGTTCHFTAAGAGIPVGTGKAANKASNAEKDNPIDSNF